MSALHLSISLVGGWVSSYASASDHAMREEGAARLTGGATWLVEADPERDAALVAPSRSTSVSSRHAAPQTAIRYVRDDQRMIGQASDLVRAHSRYFHSAESISPKSNVYFQGKSNGTVKTRASLHVPSDIERAASTADGLHEVAYRSPIVVPVDAASGVHASTAHLTGTPPVSHDAHVAQAQRAPEAAVGSSAPAVDPGEANEPWPAMDAHGFSQPEQKATFSRAPVDIAVEQPAESRAAGELRVGKFSFPENLLGSLEQGIEVPVRVKTAAGSEEAGKASIKYAGGDITLTDFALSKIKLTEASKQQIAALQGKPLSVVAEATPAAATPDTILAEFNLRTFEVLAQLPEEAYAAEGEARSFALADSTEKHLSGVLNYDVSGVKNARSEANGYLHVKSVTGYGVYHAYVDGDVRTDSDMSLYEARIERDFKGFNVTGGYLGTWAMSALGQTTFLPGGKFFGISAGNTARSEINDGSLARTPLFAFMPASGEVQIYRDGKLINVQRVSIGNQEIDTRSLPVGSYAVRVDVVVNGRVVSSKAEQVYKPGNGGTGKDTQYQFFGGQYIANGVYGQGSVAEPLIGASGKTSTRFGTFHGSSYYFHGLAAAELRYQRNFKYGSLGIDTGLTTDGGFRLNANGAANYGPVSGWVNHMVTTGSSPRNGVYNQRTTSFGGNVNVAQVFGWKKSASLGVSASVYQGSNQDYRLDWNQDIYTNKWMRVSLSGGQMFSRNSQPGRTWNKAFYVGLNASFSFGDGGIDYSRSRDSEQIGAHIGWKPTQVDGLDYVSAGVNHSRALNGGRGNASSTQANMSAQGHNSLFGWQGNLSLDDTGDLSGTAAAQGTVGWNVNGIGFTSKRGESGVIVGVDKAARGQLELTSEGNRQLLGGRSTFVPLTGYKAHTVQIRTRRDTPENFDIQDGEAKLVLYPGNVASIRPKVRRLVTVFGVLTENGTIRPNTEIQNHIGKTVTDAAGGFVIDVDSSYPSIQYQTDSGGTCKIDFDLSAAQGALWVNEVSCEPARVAKANAAQAREG
ncbi:TcfC E-set like domain-containing protein [Burkholderia diffusa]|uniref:TcfC E-set like domain-containing protein n=1 Tax=Burkholderia diffusa TaxID=488732 RepID=UPI0018C6B046|nr:TcfC E-set like domain-containing protein [Burkholderia diffusa]